ncbi:glutamine amidotransferase-related protein, partial [Arthrobacter globiformis]|uniref:glutamine amidotransferase-related protein n=2 Tax=Arthrobacter TaxID=1663 RepID=UPI003F5921EE
ERYGRVEVSHVSLNDEVVEGLACLDIPAFSVQYHPEAAAGPHDAAYLFDRFIELMEGTRDGRTANLSKEPVDSQHPAEAQNQAGPNTTDNKTEDKK